MLVTAYVRNPVSGVTMKVDVIIDTGSSVTLLSQNAAEFLGLKGNPFPLKISGIGDHKSLVESRFVTFDLESMDKMFNDVISDAQVVPVITNDIRPRDWRNLLERYGLTGHPPADNGRIDLLIGWDNPLLLLQQDYKIVTQQFLFIKTFLGWSGCGQVRRKGDNSAKIQYTVDIDSVTDLGQVSDRDPGGVNVAMPNLIEDEHLEYFEANSSFEVESEFSESSEAALDSEVNRDVSQEVLVDVDVDRGNHATVINDSRALPDTTSVGKDEDLDIYDDDASGDAEWAQNFTFITSQWLADAGEGDNSDLSEKIFLTEPSKEGGNSCSKRVSSTATPAEIRHLIDLVQSSSVYDKFPETGMTVEETRCSEILRDSYHIEDGHVYVSPLWKRGQPSGFINNFAYAQARLKSIHKKMSQTHFECIDNIFEEYISKHGVVEDITGQVKDPYTEPGIWWPHFPVENTNSETTPVRPVMDGRAPCLGNPKRSINDHCFSPGPCLLCDLVDVTLRYRKHDVPFTGDISKMFLKVRVPERDKMYGRFVWYQKDRKTLRFLQFSGHVFGKVCSPTCALYATQRNANDHRSKMPRAAETVCKSTLVDDSLDSVPTEEEAYQVIVDLVKMHEPIGLTIAKFATNSINVAKQLPEYVRKSESMKMFELYGPKEMEYAPGTIRKMPTVRALGQYHNMILDTFGYESHEAPKIIWTKTSCLSQMMRVYDPLGFAIPVMLETKLFMQDLWKREAVWTDVLTDQERERWMLWLKNLPLLKKLEYKRTLMPGLPDNFESVQLHIFSDASALAFASVAYIRISYKDNRPVYTNFVSAKNNISPVKVKRTIPKLELMSIEQGARLAKKVTGALDIKPENVTLWSDSKTALQWLRMDSETLLPLIHNNVNKIKAHYPISQIRWVPGTENPADVATRPKTVEELVTLPIWKTGPDFLVESPSAWPVLAELEPPIEEVMDGIKKDFKIFSVCMLNRKRGHQDRRSKNDGSDQGTLFKSKDFRTYDLMKRVVACWLRYVKLLWERRQARVDGNPMASLLENYQTLKSRSRKETKSVPLYTSDKKGKLSLSYVKVPTLIPATVPLSQEELKEAELRLVKQHQKIFFREEIYRLRSGRDLLLSNKLGYLGPVLTVEQSHLGDKFNFELLRLSGRLSQATHLRMEMRQPFVLHPKDEMVKKFVQHFHQKVLKHMGGVRCLQCEINRSAWIVGSISYLKRILTECVECRKTHPKPTIQQMAPLPISRIPGDRESRPTPFRVTALDAAGPWHTVIGRGKQKRWLLIFRCTKIGAVCLETLYGMDTDSFLRALSRFCSHYAKPKRIICDNGTNFVGGEKEINYLWQNLNKDSIRRNQQNIEFNWSPAQSPHFNGLIERMVQEAKRNLDFVLKSTDRLTDDDLNTAFKEVQRLLNNRPIEKLNTLDGKDAEPLTPAHFLSSGNIHEDLVMPSHLLEMKETPLAKQFLALRGLMDLFWTRYVSSMTKQLREYNKSRKWVRERPPVMEGDVVCLLDKRPDKDKRYRLGLIVSTSQGEDGLPRRVTIRVAEGQLLERGLDSFYVIVPAKSPEALLGEAKKRELRRSKRKRKLANSYLLTFPQEESTTVNDSRALPDIGLDQVRH